MGTFVLEALGPKAGAIAGERSIGANDVMRDSHLDFGPLSGQNKVVKADETYVGGKEAMNDRLEPRILILLGSSIAIGPGKAALLQAISETGSIAAAGRRMGMSYRRAWVWREYGDLYILDGAGRVHTVCSLLRLGRFSLLTAVLAGIGRAAAEVGAILIVGGNIAGVTRTMTTAIALETSRGDLSLALGLGIILLSLILAVNATAQFIRNASRRAAAI